MNQIVDDFLICQPFDFKKTQNGKMLFTKTAVFVKSIFPLNSCELYNYPAFFSLKLFCRIVKTKLPGIHKSQWAFLFNPNYAIEKKS